MIYQIIIYNEKGNVRHTRQGPEANMRRLFKKWGEDLDPGWSIALRTDRVQIMRYTK